MLNCRRKNRLGGAAPVDEKFYRRSTGAQ